MIKKIFFGVLVALLALAFSCSDTDETAGFDELSDFAKSFLSLRSNSAATVGGPVSGAINRSFQNLSGFAFSGGRKKDGPNEGDTTIVDPLPWQSCAQITEFDNEDGSHTVIYDYGEGCEEGWGEYTWLMFGKFTETYRYLFNQSGSEFIDDYYYNVDYNNYGGRFSFDSISWKLNGTSVYQGTSTYDTATSKFSGSFNYDSETDYNYGDWSYAYAASGATEYNEKQYAMKSGEYRYTQGTDFYHSEVLKPLVYRYDCFSLSVFEGCFMMTYVSGQERITYRQGDKEGSFIIDYGNGECDNVIIIIENGLRIKVDLNRDPWLIAHN
ncbi:MAG: hypothetical protein HRU69_05520 [Flammeovirgaceae bacterium]|nr:MAG: hypothetical protein HRU69_05520 [Flammeovirgaceae bacterium]